MVAATTPAYRDPRAPLPPPPVAPLHLDRVLPHRARHLDRRRHLLGDDHLPGPERRPPRHLPLALPAIWLLLVCARGFARLERSRVAALLGVHILDPVPPLQSGLVVQRLRERGQVGAPVEGGRLLPAPPAARRPHAVVSCRRVVRLAGAGRAAALRRVLPDDSAKFGFFDVGRRTGRLGRRHRAGRLVVLLAPWITVAMGRLDVAAARWLLGPTTGRAGGPGGRSPRPAGSPPSTAPRPSAAASSATCTTARSSAWSPWPWSWAPPASSFDDDPEEAVRALVAEAHEEAKAALQGAPRPRARHPPGDPRGPRPRRRPVGRGRPLPDPGRARGRRRARGRPPRSRAPPTSWCPRRSPTSPATPAPPRPRCRWCASTRPPRRSRSATTAGGGADPSAARPSSRTAAPASPGCVDASASLGGSMPPWTARPGGPTILRAELPCES